MGIKDFGEFDFDGIEDSLQLGSAKKKPSNGPDRYVHSRDQRDDAYNPLDGVDLHSDTLSFSSRQRKNILVPPGVPEDFESYKRLLHRAFDSLDDILVERLFAEKLLVSASRSWNLRDPQGNYLIAGKSFEILSKAMGETYFFKPSSLAFGKLYRDNAIGLFLYGKGWEKVVLSKSLLSRPFKSLLETVVHEQIHRLQHSLTCRLNQAMTDPLPKNLHSLVLYWLRDEPNRKTGYLSAARSSPEESKRILRSLAMEYHAYERSEYVIGKIFP